MLALVLVATSVGISNLAASIGVGAGGVDRGTRLRVAAIFGLFEAGMPIVGLLIGHGLAIEVGREARWLAAAMLAAVGGYGIFNAWRSGKRAGPAAAGQGADSGSGTPRGQNHDAQVGAPFPPNQDAQVGAPSPPNQDAQVGAPSGQVGDQPPGDAKQPHHGRQQSIQLLVSGLALSLDNLVAGFALGAYQVSILTGAAVFGTVSVLMSMAGLEFGARIGKRSGQRGEIIGGVVLIGVGVAIGAGAIG